MCLAAVLLLGAVPAGSVYAGDEGVQTTVERNEDVIVEVDGENNSQDLADDNTETDNTGTPTAETPTSGDTETPTTETPETPTSESPAQAGETPVQEEDAAETTVPEPAETPAETQTETSGSMEPEQLDTQALDVQLLDAVSNDNSLLTLLNSTASEDLQTLLAAMGAAETVPEDAFLAYLADLQGQTATITTALGQDLSLRYVLTSDDAAEALGVTQTAVDLYNIRLNAVNDLVLQAKAENNAELLCILGNVPAIPEVPALK
jgi:hypothetical protein